MRSFTAAVILALSGAAMGQAQELWLHELPYADARAIEPVVETFEGHPNARFEGTLRIEGAAIGQMLAGQSLMRKSGRGEDVHWVLANRVPELPLALAEVAEGAVAAVVRDGAFRSFALAGIGPPQTMPGRMRLGSGIVTILFDEPQCLFGLVTWLDGEQDNIVMREHPEGNLNLIFWRRDVTPLADFRRFTDQGRVELAYVQSAGGGPEILAVTIQNLDPGGIGIDEILYSPLCPMMVSALPARGGPG
jgi:hypothetical protein